MLRTPRCSFIELGLRVLAPAAARAAGPSSSTIMPRIFGGHNLATAISTVSVVVLTSGCAKVGPNFNAPDAPVHPSWIDADDPALQIEQVDQQDWWKTFQDPVLDALVAKAAEQNLTLQILGLRVFEARALVGVAVGSLFPQSQTANAGAQEIRLSDNAEPVSNLPSEVGSLVDTRFQRYGVSLDAAWELDLWGRIRRGVEASEANLAASLATYDDFLVTLNGDVAGTYILLRTLEERLAVAQSNVAIQKRSLEIADVRFRNGVVTELDVQLATALLGNTAANIPLIEVGIRRTQLALSLLLGMPPSDLAEILGGAGVIPTVPEQIAVGLPADLLRRRPDVRRSLYIAAAQSARIGIAKADFYPSFRLLGGIGYAADSTGDVFDSDSVAGVGGLGFSWKILNYGRLRNNLRIQDARFQQLVAAYQNTVLNAAREVEDGLVSYLRAKERVESLTLSVEAAKRAVELAAKQYSDGLISYTLVLDANQFLSLNQDLETASRGEVARNLVTTYKAMGGGWQIREGKPLIPDEVKATMQERTPWGNLLDEPGETP